MILSELRARGWQIGCIAASAALLGALAWGGVQSGRVATAQLATALVAKDWAEEKAARSAAEAAASEQARLRERELVTRSNAVAAAFERGKQYADAKGQSTAADLRAGRLHFRRLWQECEARPGGVPGPAADPAEPAGVSPGRADSTGRIVRATEFDAQLIRCLQADALTIRGLDPGDLSNGCPEVSP